MFENHRPEVESSGVVTLTQGHTYSDLLFCPPHRTVVKEGVSIRGSWAKGIWELSYFCSHSVRLTLLWNEIFYICELLETKLWARHQATLRTGQWVPDVALRPRVLRLCHDRPCLSSLAVDIPSQKRKQKTDTHTSKIKSFWLPASSLQPEISHLHEIWTQVHEFI